MSRTRENTHNFAAGPSPLPTPVLQKASEGLLNYNGTGMGICEISHRSKEFESIITGAAANLRKLLNVPENYEILFTQSGGTGQFSSVVLNILSAHRQKHSATPLADYTPPILDYVVTGTWSTKAHEEALRLSLPPNPSTPPFAQPRIAATTKPTKYTTLPHHSSYDFSPDAAMVYYCENETINGIQFPKDPSSPHSFPFHLVPDHIPIVADYSSSFISRPILNIEKHGIIYAGAQKNLGPSGVTVVIVRKDLLVDTTEVAKLGGVPNVPITIEYQTMSKNGSMYNTPPTFTIYVCALVLEYLIGEKGGIEGLEAVNEKKARLLYDTLDEAEKRGVARSVVRERDARSWMNVTFEMVGEGKNAEFMKGGADRGFMQLAGHRSVGGVRASLYNAVSLESVEKLCDYIREFAGKQA